eukprot:Clim_evm13s145 gene=Clim_evmTU13s145
MVQRVTYRRRSSYNTKSNKIRQVRTPGGKLVAQYKKKLATVPKCGGCSVKLQGIQGYRPKKLMAISKTKKTVTRAYGGNLCCTCLRDKVIRAFLVEEQKIVKRVMRQQAQA